MNKEIKFENIQEETKFKQELASRIINGEFEVIPSHNNETKNYNFLTNSVFRNTTTTEYFKLISGYQNTNGSWTKVREIINDQPKTIKSKYLFKAQLGGNFGLVGRVNLEVQILNPDSELEFSIKFRNADVSNYLQTSVKFGLISSMESMINYKVQIGKFKIIVDDIGFHEIDSSTITIAYTANMALRRALDKEKIQSSFNFQSGRFNLYKKYPVHKSFK